MLRIRHTQNQKALQACIPLFALAYVLFSPVRACSFPAQNKASTTSADHNTVVFQMPNLNNRHAQQQIRQWRDEQLANFIKTSDGAAENTFEARICDRAAAGVYRSIRYRVCVFMGGAHPTIYSESFVFDMRTGKRLLFADFFTDPQAALPFLARTVTHELRIEKGKLAPVAKNFRNFILEKNGIRFFFPIYQLGPRSDGEKKVLVPYAELRRVLNPETAATLTTTKEQQ